VVGEGCVTMVAICPPCHVPPTLIVDSLFFIWRGARKSLRFALVLQGIGGLRWRSRRNYFPTESNLHDFARHQSVFPARFSRR
jgi:hypothetical protein